jgi:hypothetical protein
MIRNIANASKTTHMNLEYSRPQVQRLGRLAFIRAHRRFQMGFSHTSLLQIGHNVITLVKALEIHDWPNT